ncbi:Senescence/dehydration-associated protein At3g51250 [Linum grandiflorum]
MASQNPNSDHKSSSLYPQVIQSNPEAISSSTSSTKTSNLYPTIDKQDLIVDNVFPEHTAERHKVTAKQYSPSAPPMATEELLITIPGAILNLVDKTYSVELASGDLSVVLLRQGNSIVAVLARVGNEIQWPLGKEGAAVKLDESHYFFSLRLPQQEQGSDSSGKKDKKAGKNEQEEMLNYGLTIASKGQERVLKELDEIFKTYCCFSVQKVSDKANESSMANEISPKDFESEEKKAVMEGNCAAYWTALAPNVEDYSSSAARLIATGSAQLIKGILWCGDVTVDRLKKGNEAMKQRMSPKSNAEVSPETMDRIRRVKRMTEMTEKVANGVLSGVVKVSGLFTSSVANSKVGKKVLSLLPGEIVLASLDGFSKVFDAVEVAGRSVMSTSSDVTTDIVSHRYGEEAGKATNEGLGAAGHAFGVAWAALKIRKALNPKSALKPTKLAKSVKVAAEEVKAKAAK